MKQFDRRNAHYCIVWLLWGYGLMAGLPFGCKGVDLPGPVDTTPKVDTTAALVWRRPLSPDSSICASFGALFHNGRFMVGRSLVTSTGEDIAQFDALTGQRGWVWLNTASGASGNPIFGNQHFPRIAENVLTFGTTPDGNLYGINPATGIPFWSKPTRKGANNFGTWKSHLYFQQLLPSGGHAAIIQANVHTGAEDTLYTVPAIDGYTPNPKGFCGLTAANGDDILVFQHVRVKSPYSKIDLYGYNLTRDSLAWATSTVEDSVNYPHIAVCVAAGGSDVYYLHQRGFACYNGSTGARKWNTAIVDNPYGPYQFRDHKLFVCGPYLVALAFNSERLYCLDRETGEVLWKLPGFGGAENVHYFREKLYVAAKNMYAIDPEKGAITWRFRNPTGSVFASPAIDTANGNILLVDWKHVSCYKIPQ